MARDKEVTITWEGPQHMTKETECTLLHLINNETAWNDLQEFLAIPVRMPLKDKLLDYIIHRLDMPEEYYLEMNRIGERTEWADKIDWKEVARQVEEVQNGG